MTIQRRGRPAGRGRGESFPTFFKVLVPVFLIGLAVFQSMVNHGHVDNNVIGALVFIALGGAVGYIADRFIQAWLGIGNTTTLPQREPDDEVPFPRPGESGPRKRKHRDR